MGTFCFGQISFLISFDHSQRISNATDNDALTRIFCYPSNNERIAPAQSLFREHRVFSPVCEDILERFYVANESIRSGTSLSQSNIKY